jgi:hypothetical protein
VTLVGALQFRLSFVEKKDFLHPPWPFKIHWRDAPNRDGPYRWKDDYFVTRLMRKNWGRSRNLLSAVASQSEFSIAQFSAFSCWIPGSDDTVFTNPMPKAQLLPVSALKLDLKNYRTVPQKNERDAFSALVTLDPKYFWGLTESLLADGFTPNESLLVLETTAGGHRIREGNRRTASLKLCLGLLSSPDVEVPEPIARKIKELDPAWVSKNSKVPCVIYQTKEAQIVDALVDRIHGYQTEAGRLRWTSVSRARHSREEKGTSEPGLDLLEKYLTEGRNLTDHQRELWAGDYFLTVLDEAIVRLASRLGQPSSKHLADAYPKISKKKDLDSVLLDIGNGIIGFSDIRTDPNFGALYKMPPPPPAASAGASAPGAGTASGQKRKARASNDPSSIRGLLMAFVPRGKGRDKIVTLLKELRKMNLAYHAHAFCFVLRSMFEISAKAYCDDNSPNGGPKMTKANGDDKHLKDALDDIYKHLVADPANPGKQDKVKVKFLHPAIAELARPESLLSVTSMNQLIHNPKFTMTETHISAVFGNVFSLLVEMNK